jgi:AcrR family transcriptional regulator
MMDSRRIRMTKRILRECVLELLKEKPISNISVRELCSRADIHRSSFYHHYSDIYDLFESLENESVEQLTRYMEQRVRRKNQISAMTDLLSYLQDNSDLHLTLVRSSLTYTGHLRDTVFQVYSRYYQDIGKSFSDEDMCLIDFNTAGTLEVIQKWLTNDKSRSPQEMAAMVFSCVKNGEGPVLSD